MLAGDYPGAIESLGAAIRDRRDDAEAIFLRGLARERLGSDKAAQDDYNLASRVALTEASKAGDAHHYRGIWLFRRGDYAHAESEFAASLNSGVDPAAQADVMAWWRMAAVARGECEASARYLRDSLATVSGFFPKGEAEDLLGKCGSVAARLP